MMKISSLPMRLSLKRKDVDDIKLRTILSSLKYPDCCGVRSSGIQCQHSLNIPEERAFTRP